MADHYKLKEFCDCIISVFHFGIISLNTIQLSSELMANTEICM